MNTIEPVNKNLADSEIYKLLCKQIDAICVSEEPIISVFGNVAAAIKDAFRKMSWVGFYFLKNDRLILGPYQGKIACSFIYLGKGVCGLSAAKKEAIIVDDVNKFPGHIVCDSDARSEIVIPIIKDNIIYGVMDIDSCRYSAFNETDRSYLIEIVSLITRKLDFEKIKHILI